MIGADRARAVPVDFMILGAQKAGTSWLHERLRDTPGLWLPVDKDDEFFSYPRGASVDAYRTRFATAPENVSIGDACASYFWTSGRSSANPGFEADLPASIDQALGPGARYIVLLRDPVERALSAYLHHVAFGSLRAGVPLLDAPPELGLVDIGRYGHHLQAWLDRVGPDRMLVRPAPGDIEPAELVADVAAFLRVDAPEAVSGEAVFPGLQRWRDDAGVWVALGQPGVAAPAGPVREFDGREATLVIDARSVTAVADALRSDTARLAQCLARQGWVHSAYRRWSTWPDGA